MEKTANFLNNQRYIGSERIKKKIYFFMNRGFNTFNQLNTLNIVIAFFLIPPFTYFIYLLLLDIFNSGYNEKDIFSVVFWLFIILFWFFSILYKIYYKFNMYFLFGVKCQFIYLLQPNVFSKLQNVKHKPRLRNNPYFELIKK